MNPIVQQQYSELVQAVTEAKTALAGIDRCAQLIADALLSGKKVLAAGNGGSAADALHLCEELVGRYRTNRRYLPAISLAADGTALTCIGNDFGFENVFSRQVEGLGNKGDMLVCFSTSGNSPNILRALDAAKIKGVKSVALLGKDGGKAKGKADFEIIVANSDNARVQEAHTLILHALLEVIELDLAV